MHIKNFIFGLLASVPLAAALEVSTAADVADVVEKREFMVSQMVMRL
jgi:hypothetical protein